MKGTEKFICMYTRGSELQYITLCNRGEGLEIWLFLCRVVQEGLNGLATLRISIAHGAWWYIGRVNAFRPLGHGFDSRSSRHVETSTHRCRWNSGTLSELCREHLWVVVNLKRRYRNSLDEWTNEWMNEYCDMARKLDFSRPTIIYNFAKKVKKSFNWFALNK